VAETAAGGGATTSRTSHLRLIIEYDGRQHAEDSRQWLADIFRREELDQMRWRLVSVTSEGIYRDPLRTLERE
jgi:very-short-patch-repair endonuclease